MPSRDDVWRSAALKQDAARRVGSGLGIVVALAVFAAVGCSSSGGGHGRVAQEPSHATAPGTTAPAPTTSAVPSSAPSTTAAPSTSSSTAAPPTTTPAANVPASPGPGWLPVVSSAGRAVMWTRSLVVDGEAFTAALFDHRSTTLVVHAGGAIPAADLGRVVSAFNGGFLLGTGVSGIVANGASQGVFQQGMAAVVTYGDGSTALGAWGRDLPMPGAAVVSARSNLHLLVDGGRPAPDASAIGDWGAVLRSVGSATARASLGILPDGDLVWVGSMAALPGPLADAQVAVGAVRAMELDINPEWVGLFGFVNGAPQVLLPGQNRPADTYVAGWSRDFFTIDAR